MYRVLQIRDQTGMLCCCRMDMECLFELTQTHLAGTPLITSLQYPEAAAVFSVLSSLYNRFVLTLLWRWCLLCISTY